MQKLTSVYYLCYFEGLPDVESYRAFLDGEFLYMENRGIREGYPLARAAAPFKDSTYLYVDFPGLARVRIPLSAFPSGDALRDFEEYVCDKMEMPRDAAEALERSLFELQKPEACPQCGEPEMMRIIYGRPTAEGWLRIASGEACHGPDFIRPWLPDWHCTGCGHEWFVASDPGKRQHERLIESVLEKKKRKSA